MREVEPPHILMIVCHDLGRRLGCYGVPGLRTPVVDGLADEGVRFLHAFSTAPLCSPSRGSLQTGCYPHTHGLMGLVNRGWELPDAVPTLPQSLAAGGYRTLLFGLHHEKRDPARMGYQHVLSADGPRHATAVLPLVAEFLRSEAREGGAGGPFFAAVGLTEVHRPFDHPRYSPDNPGTVDVPAWLPDRPEVRDDLAHLHGLIRAVDVALAEVCDALRASALDRRTLLIFTTDHGIAFPRGKSTLYDSGIGTALIARWPGVLTAGGQCHRLVSGVDLMPSLLAAAGQPVPGHVQGRPFWSVVPGAPDWLRGEQAAPWRDEVHAEKTFHDAYDPMRAVRTERWKYIRSFEERPELLLPLDIARSPSAAAVADAAQRPRPPEELYDLVLDPAERVNLAGDAGHGAVLADMRRRLREWMEATDDPLRKGPIAAPPGAEPTV